MPYLVVGNREFVFLMNLTGHILNVFRDSEEGENFIAVTGDYRLADFVD